MKIKANIPHQLRMQIVHCIELLGAEYTSLNFTLEVYLNREKLEYERKNKPIVDDGFYEQILHGEIQPPGITIPEKKLIKLFLFNLEDIKDVTKYKIELVANLFHEIRHAWQYENNQFNEEKEIKNIDQNKEQYFKLHSEQDAYLFQEEQMNKNMYAIVSIMDMNYGFKYTLRNDIRELM